MPRMICRSCKNIDNWNVIGLCRECIRYGVVKTLHDAAPKRDDEGAVLIMQAVAK